MTPRLAELKDIPRLVALGEKFHAMAPHFKMGNFDPLAMSRVLKFMITSPNSVVFTNGRGVIGGTLSPVYFNPSKIMLEENFWWAEEGGRPLLTAMEEWGKQQGATFILLSTLENSKTHVIKRLMERRGYAPIEHQFIKELSQ